MGIRKQPRNSSLEKGVGYYNIVPFLAYYDIFKNYYANKQEERFYVMGGSSIQNKTTIVADAWTGKVNGRRNLRYTGADSAAKITITGTNININDIESIKYTLDGAELEMMFVPQLINGEYFNVIENTPDKIVLGLKRQRDYFFLREFAVPDGTLVKLSETTDNIAQGTVSKAYTSSFPLTEIDELREYILSKGRQEILINKESDEKLKSLFIYNVLFSPNPEEDGTPQSIPPIGTLEMGGLCLKTHQSDLFNNWVNKDWVDGDNGINAVTDVVIS